MNAVITAVLAVVGVIALGLLPACTDDSAATTESPDPSILVEARVNEDPRDGWVMVYEGRSVRGYGGRDRYIGTILKMCDGENIVYVTVPHYIDVAPSMSVLPGSPECSS